VYTDVNDAERNANGRNNHAHEDPDRARADGIEDGGDEEHDRIDGGAFQNNANNMEKVYARTAWRNIRGTRRSLLTDETKGNEAGSQNILEDVNWKNNMS